MVYSVRTQVKELSVQISTTAFNMRNTGGQATSGMCIKSSTISGMSWKLLLENHGEVKVMTGCIIKARTVLQCVFKSGVNNNFHC